MAEAITILDDDDESQQLIESSKETDEEIIVLDDDATSAPPKAQVAENIDCPICLQVCVHPCKLPCRHIFCFLCVKGLKNRLCAMCRQEFPIEFLERPELVTTNAAQEAGSSATEDSEYQWFYRGRNGWWQYDPRTCQEIEDAYKNGEKHCTILVAGYVYIVDFEQMLQQRQNDPSRKRQVKRDFGSVAKKGVAGLRFANVSNTSASISTDDSQHPQPSSSGSLASTSSSTAVPNLIATVEASDDALRLTAVQNTHRETFDQIETVPTATDAVDADDVVNRLELTLDNFRGLRLTDVATDSDSSDEEEATERKSTSNIIL